MSSPENPQSNSQEPSYSRGDPVRVYRERDGTIQPEDDWEYRLYDEWKDHEVASRHNEEGGVTEFEHTPKKVFDSWQREKAAAESGRLITEGSVVTSGKVAEIILRDEADLVDNSHTPPIESDMDGSPEEPIEKPTNRIDSEPDDLTDIPEEVRELSEKHGYPIEVFLRAQTDPDIADILRSKGIDWGAVHDSAELSEDTHHEVTQYQLDKAEKLHGVRVSAENIRFARLEAQQGNLRPADYLAGVGVDLGFPRLDPPDPVIRLSEVGRKRREDVVRLIARIEEDPAEVKKSLRRPGELPIGLLNLSPIRAVNKRLLAWKISRKEINDRPGVISNLQAEYAALEALGDRDELQEKEFKKLESQISKLKSQQYNDGLLGLGLPKYVLYRDYINRLDESVKAHKRRLGLLQRHKLKDSVTTRRDLAYRISDSDRSVKDLSRGVIHDYDNPESVHDHERFKNDNSLFRTSLDKRNR